MFAIADVTVDSKCVSIVSINFGYALQVTSSISINYLLFKNISTLVAKSIPT
jgi:hypothetical protein